MAIRDWLAAFSNDVVDVKEPVATELEATRFLLRHPRQPVYFRNLQAARRSETSGPGETASRPLSGFRIRISSRTSWTRKRIRGTREPLAEARLLREDLSQDGP